MVLANKDFFFLNSVSTKGGVRGIGGDNNDDVDEAKRLRSKKGTKSVCNTFSFFSKIVVFKKRNFVIWLFYVTIT